MCKLKYFASILIIQQAVFFGNSAGTIPTKGKKFGKIELSSIEVLTFFENEFTIGRRSPSVPQLQCLGKNCDTKPTSVQCYNQGWDGVDVQWECKSTMNKNIKFAKIQVSCEGYDDPDDPYILQGSCGLEYSLVGSVAAHYNIWGIKYTDIFWVTVVITLIVYESMFGKKYGSIIAAIGRNNNIRPSSSSSSRVQTHRLVKLLVQDEIAIRKWRMLHRTLGLNPAHFTTLENAYQNGTMDAETMFLKMLDEWSTVKGDQATVEQLEKILVENELVSVAEKVKSSFGNAIITIAAVATVRSITAPKWPQPEQLDNGEEEATGFAKTKRK